MAIDKAVDSGVLDAALTYTADRIRAKTGGTDQIAWDAEKGFGAAVDEIPEGSGKKIKIVMTSTVRNAEEMLSIIRAAAGTMQRYAAHALTYANAAPVENQITDIYSSATTCGIRFRNNSYGILAGFGSAYDAAVTIGDVYEIDEVN